MMQVNPASIKRQISDVKNRLRILRRENNEFENIARLASKDGGLTNKEIKELEQKLKDYEALVPTLTQAKLKIWRTVTLGNHTSLAQYKKAIEASGRYELSDYGEKLAGKIKISRAKRKIKLGKVTIRELGFKHTYLKTAFDTICKLGGRPCPDDVALALICDPSFKERGGIFFMRTLRISKWGKSAFEIDCGSISPIGTFSDPNSDYTTTYYRSLSAYPISDEHLYDNATIFFMIPDQARL